MANGDTVTHRENFWIKIAGYAFALWSIMLPISAGMIVRSLERESAARMELDASFVKYREETLKAIITISERQSIVLQRLDKIDKMLDGHAVNGKHR